MSVYSEQLAVGKATPSAPLTFTAAAGGTTVIRDIELYNQGSSSTVTFVALWVSGVLVGVFASSPSLAASATLQWQGRVVLNPGNQLVVNVGVGDVLAIISGYFLQ